jgi:hypothetical protein
VNPGGESGWDEPPLDIQIPDDARELERDVLAYHRELRAMRRRRRLHTLTRPFAGQTTVMPLLASILAVCLVAGAMLSVATFGPATAPANHSHPSATAASGHSAPEQTSPATSAPASAPSASPSGPRASGSSASGPSASGPNASGNRGTARPSGSANASARSSPAASRIRPTTPGGP